MKSGYFSKLRLHTAVILILCAILSSCSPGELIYAPAAADVETEPFTEQLRTYVWETESETAVYEEPGYEYDFKLYAVTAGQRDALTPFAYDVYCKTVDAFINASETIEMTADQADTVVSALAECFPPVWLAESLTFTPYTAETQSEETTAGDESEESDESAINQNPINGILKITYKYDKIKHSENIDSFFKRTAFIMNDSGAATAATDEIAAILLYRYTAKTVTDVAGKRTSSYDAIMYGTGEADGDIKYTSGGSHILAYIYFLLQSGIDCTAVTGLFYNSPRMLCAVMNDGELFYCDPAGEMNDTMGAGLNFFGINDAGLSDEGLSSPVEAGISAIFLFHYISSDSAAEEPADSEETEKPVPSFILKSDSVRYNVFRGSDYFEFDDKESQITVYYRGSFDQEIYICG
ncbi:MAG: hypothetical protein ACYCWE_20625 [Eubacteriales bacterium]